jgi:hypothetical protein
MRRPLLAAVVLAALVACGHKDDNHVALSDSKAQAESVAQVLSKASHASGGHQFGPPTGKIRVANLLELGGTPSGPLDFYDTRQPDSSAKPLISNLAFGQVSDYVSPRAADAYPGSPSNLYSFPAGTKKPSPPFGDRIDNQGYSATDQVTVALGPTSFAGGQGIALPAIDEAGTRVNAFRDSTRVIPSGKALLVVLQANTNVNGLPALWLKVDTDCPLNANDARNTHPVAVGTDLNLAISPGVHTVGVVTSPRGQGLPTCAGKTPAQTISLTVATGQRYIVMVYGLPSDQFKALAVPMVTQ